MVGQCVESRPGMPVAAIVFLIGALVFLAFAVVNQSVHLALGAVLPAALGVALLVTRPRPFAADLNESGLDVHEPPLNLPYDAINGIAVEGRPAATAAMRLVHMRGVLTIPARLNVPSDLLYEFLLSRVPPTGSRELNPDLMPYLQQQEALFGPEKVFSYRAQWHAKAPPRRRATAVCTPDTARTAP